MKIIYTLWVCILFAPGLIWADKAILKNGQTLNGNVESQSDGLVFFRVTNGELMTIKKDDIVTLIYAESRVTIRPKSSEQAPSVQASEPTKTTSPVMVSDRERITERVSVDKDLTESVMKRFDDADKRRDNQIQSQMDLLREELKYLKEEKERLAKSNQDNEEFRKTLDKRMAGLEIRIRRLERYLGMDETMIEYYQKPRSPWDLVRRSALFPGWGHRYAREEYTGNVYSTTFIILLGLGYFVNYQAESAEKTVKDKFNGDIAVRALQSSSIGASDAIATTTLLSTYNGYQTSMNGVNSQKRLGSILFNGAIVLYGVQLVHAYFTGVDWAKSSPRDYSNESLLKSPVSWNFQMTPDLPPVSFSTNANIGTFYNLQFSRSF
jgi:prefoldin subunit 5